MAKNKNSSGNKNARRNLREMMQLDTVAQKMLSVIDPNYNEREVLNGKNDKFQSIVNREYEISKGVTGGGNIVDFMLSLRENDKKAAKSTVDKDIDINTLFEANMGDIFDYFKDLYKNRYVEIRDLKFISKFIPALGEAVKTTLDGVVTSDDLSKDITRNLVFSSSLSNEDREKVIGKVETMEEQYDLLKKLKNVVYKNSLVTGNYYVYAVPYTKLFSEYSKAKAAGKFDQNNVWNQQNVLSDNITRIGTEGTLVPNMDIACESCLTTEDFTKAVKPLFESDMSKDKSFDKAKFDEELKAIAPEVFIYSGNYLVDAVKDSAALETASTYAAFFNRTETKPSETGTDEGSMYSEVSAGGGKVEKFENISGTYLKFIDYKNIIPIRILNQTVGYYHIYVEKKKKDGSNSILGSSTVFSMQSMSEKKKEAAIQGISDIITNKIVSKFSEKFVVDNADFKKMIADCVLEHGVSNNQFHIQFIPAEDIIEFPVNPDENGDGVSILADALFPAKMLLSLIVCKLLLYINNSGSKSIAHIYKGPIDLHSANQVERVIRNLQESNVTFVDLLSTNLSFNKFARDSRIAMPTTKNGQHLVEFETMDGQTVDLKTDLEDKLEQMAIMGTGVPSVIMEYVNQADFAKSITTANIKFAGRVAGYQGDFEGPTTRLYRKLIANSGIEGDVISSALNSFQFKLPRPKALSTSNSADFLDNMNRLADMMVSTMIGEAGSSEGDNPKIKDVLKKKIVQKYSPYIDWSDVEDMYKEAKMAIDKEMKSGDDDASGTGDTGDEI